MGKEREHSRGLRIVALFEGAKGVLVLLVGFGLLKFIHKDVYDEALRLVEHFHINPASHYPGIFLNLTQHITDTKLRIMALAATTYSLVRLIEAAGLWLRKSWAKWFAVLTGGIYIPFEVYELTHAVTWPRVTLLVVNQGVVFYLLFILIRDSKESSKQSG